MSRNLAPCCSIIRAAWPRVQADFSMSQGTSRKLYVIETDRTTSEQVMEYAKGRTAPGRIVTNADGVIRLSKHQVQIRHDENACHALDAGVMVDGRADWKVADYQPLMNAAERQALVSGLDWNDNGIADADEHVHLGPNDGPHVECGGVIIGNCPAPESSGPDMKGPQP
jgi:hypothetical protein